MKLKFTFSLLALCTALHAEPALTAEDRDALEVGKAVLTVDRALQYRLPDAPSPEDTAKSAMLTKEMVRAGQITRLYPWVRARIDGEIALAKSTLRDTRPEPARERQLNDRIKYLERVRLLIDAPH